MTYTIAALAVETGIAPQYLTDLDSDMFFNMIQVLKDRNEAMRNASRAKRPR
jgi:hypothetical protein